MSGIVVYLIAIAITSIVAAWFFSTTKKTEKTIQIMTFLLYSWLFAFGQLVIFGLLYHYKILA